MNGIVIVCNEMYNSMSCKYNTALQRPTTQYYMVWLRLVEHNTTKHIIMHHLVVAQYNGMHRISVFSYALHRTAVSLDVEPCSVMHAHTPKCIM